MDMALTVDEIMRALLERRVMLFYQAIVCAKTKKIDHFEALLRLVDEDGEIITPNRFIGVAEDNNLIHHLDRRVLDVAAVTLHVRDNIRLAVNISAATLKNDVAAHDYLAKLKSLGPQARQIMIELTETLDPGDLAGVNAFASAARAMGCRFAIDDFGAGHSSFKSLMAAEADEIKIDGSFARGIATTAYKQSFVRLIVDMAQTFDIKTVAECVDNEADAQMLTEYGVDFLQGYLYSKPTAEPDWPLARPQSIPLSEVG